MAAPGQQMAAVRPSFSCSPQLRRAGWSSLGADRNRGMQIDLTSSANLASVRPFARNAYTTPTKLTSAATKAFSGVSDKQAVLGLPIDLKG